MLFSLFVFCCFFASLFNVTIPKKFGSAMKILVKIKFYRSFYLLEDYIVCVKSIFKFGVQNGVCRNGMVLFAGNIILYIFEKI